MNMRAGFVCLRKALTEFDFPESLSFLTSRPTSPPKIVLTKMAERMFKDQKASDTKVKMFSSAVKYVTTK